MAEKPIIIVKKYKKAHHGSHGGSWKIAYADFVTAMMAFFLLMWLVNVASEETKKGIADYFTASVITMKAASTGTGMMGGEISQTQSGNSEVEVENNEVNQFNSYNSDIPNNNKQLLRERQLFPNDTAASEAGEKKANIQNSKIKKHGKGVVSVESVQKTDAQTDASQPPKAAIKKEKIIKKDDLTQEEEADQQKKQQDKTAVITKIMAKLRQAFNSLQELEKFKHNLIIELTDEGVKIQIIDSAENEMFKSGSPVPVKYTENVIKAIGKIISGFSNKINISGHTDSQPYNNKNGYSNWELSSDRSHATRRILEDCNIKNDRFLEVSGRADRDPFNKENTNAPENRRISITVLYNDLQEPQQENTVDSKENKAEFL
jgi:chemotaxis protein MotB